MLLVVTDLKFTYLAIYWLITLQVILCYTSSFNESCYCIYRVVMVLCKGNLENTIHSNTWRNLSSGGLMTLSCLSSHTANTGQLSGFSNRLSITYIMTSLSFPHELFYWNTKIHSSYLLSTSISKILFGGQRWYKIHKTQIMVNMKEKKQFLNLG